MTRVYVTRRPVLDRIEARFDYNPDVSDKLKSWCKARWAPAPAKCWWVPLDQQRRFLKSLHELFDVVIDDDPPPRPPPPPPPQQPSLPVALDVIFGSVSPERRHRLARALAAAAHPDGDTPDRPAAADQLVRLATRRLR